VAGAAQRAAFSSNPTLDGCTILVIEDHPDSTELLTQILKSLRARVAAARNIEEAENRLRSRRIDLIVCDMKLPDGTGLDFISWLRGQPKSLGRIPAIAVTGYVQRFPANTATSFNAYMQKPIDLDQFCDVAVAPARGSAAI
jgi:CheY-like chemotaxis protein